MAKRITAWSYSRWSTYDKCPLQARFKFIDKLPEPDNEAQARGREVHEHLAAYVRGDMPEENPFHTAPVPGWTYFARLLNQLRELSPLVEQQWGYRQDWKPTGWFGKDTWMRAVLDVSVVYDDNTADVVDFKTGKPYPQDTARQADLYAVSMFERHPGLRHVTVRFWYLDVSQEGAEAVYRFERGMNGELKEKWEKRVAPMLQDETFVPRPGNHCHWCAFAKSKGGPCKYG